VRRSRFIGKGGTAEEFAEAEAHEMESGSAQLATLAHGVVASSATPDEVVRWVLEVAVDHLAGGGPTCR
jgi:hypothetical protein